MPANPNRRHVHRITGLIVATAALLHAPTAKAQENIDAACAIRERSAVIIDDSVNVPAAITEQARIFQLPPPAQAMHALEVWRKCLTLLDNDPLFWTMPGAVLPDFILRVRITELKAAERSLGDKAGSAVGRYIGSYLGQTAEEVPALKSAVVAVDVLCPKSRRKATTIVGRSNEIETPRAEQNSERLQQALEAVARDLAPTLSASSHLCQTTTPW